MVVWIVLFIVGLEQGGKLGFHTWHVLELGDEPFTDDEATVLQRLCDLVLGSQGKGLLLLFDFSQILNFFGDVGEARQQARGGTASGIHAMAKSGFNTSIGRLIQAKGSCEQFELASIMLCSRFGENCLVPSSAHVQIVLFPDCDNL